MDGMELCRQVRALDRGSYTYLLFTTAHASKRDFVDAVRAGADDWSCPDFPDAERSTYAPGVRTMGKQRRKYTDDFKRDAVRMMRNRGTRTVAEIADDLGVAPTILHRWAHVLDKDAVAKRNEEGETLEQEVRRLRKEVEQLKVEKAILKKAAAFFAKDSE